MFRVESGTLAVDARAVARHPFGSRYVIELGERDHVHVLDRPPGGAARAGRRYATITEALGAATAGDVVDVGPGRYTRATGETFPLVVPAGVTVARRGVVSDEPGRDRRRRRDRRAPRGRRRRTRAGHDHRRRPRLHDGAAHLRDQQRRRPYRRARLPRPVDCAHRRCRAPCDRQRDRERCGVVDGHDGLRSTRQLPARSALGGRHHDRRRSRPRRQRERMRRRPVRNQAREHRPSARRSQSCADPLVGNSRARRPGKRAAIKQCMAHDARRRRRGTPTRAAP